MTDRHAPPTAATVESAFVTLDNADAEMDNVRAHLVMWLAGFDPTPQQLFQVARSADIVSGMMSEMADSVRELAARLGKSAVG